MKIDIRTRGNVAEKTSQGLIQVFRCFYFIALMNDGQDDVLLAAFRRYDQRGGNPLFQTILKSGWKKPLVSRNSASKEVLPNISSTSNHRRKRTIGGSVSRGNKAGIVASPKRESDVKLLKEGCLTFVREFKELPGLTPSFNQ